MPRDVSLSDSKCWNGGQKWVLLLWRVPTAVGEAGTSRLHQGPIARGSWNPSNISATRHRGVSGVGHYAEDACASRTAVGRKFQSVLHEWVQPDWEKILSAVLEAGVSRHNGGLIDGEPLNAIVLWWCKGFKGLGAGVSCRGAPVSTPDRCCFSGVEWVQRSTFSPA